MGIVGLSHIFFKQGLILRPFFVVLGPLIFIRNHCVYMKRQFDTVFDRKLFFVTGVYVARGGLGGTLLGNSAALSEPTRPQVQGRGPPGESGSVATDRQ